MFSRVGVNRVQIHGNHSDCQTIFDDDVYLVQKRLICSFTKNTISNLSDLNLSLLEHKWNWIANMANAHIKLTVSVLWQPGESQRFDKKLKHTIIKALSLKSKKPFFLMGGVSGQHCHAIYQHLDQFKYHFLPIMIVHKIKMTTCFTNFVIVNLIV